MCITLRTLTVTVYVRNVKQIHFSMFPGPLPVYLLKIRFLQRYFVRHFENHLPFKATLFKQNSVFSKTLFVKLSLEISILNNISEKLFKEKQPPQDVLQICVHEVIQHFSCFFAFMQNITLGNCSMAVENIILRCFISPYTFPL